MRMNVKQNISIKKKRLAIAHRLEYFTDKGGKWHCFLKIDQHLNKIVHLLFLSLSTK